MDCERMTRERLDGEANDLPPWSVTLHTPADKTTPKYLTLSTIHSHIDGTGSLRLLLFLLQPQNSPTLLSLAKEELPNLPRLEDTVKIRPQLKHLVPIVYKELVIPLFPTRLHPLLGKSTLPWPADNVKGLKDDEVG